MKIKFPNSSGFPLPQLEQVEELQAKFNFSSQYAHFLLTQNGFVERSFCNSADRNSYLVESVDTECYQDFNALYGLLSSEKTFDLIAN